MQVHRKDKNYVVVRREKKEFCFLTKNGEKQVIGISFLYFCHQTLHPNGLLGIFPSGYGVLSLAKMTGPVIEQNYELLFWITVAIKCAISAMHA